MCARVCKIFRGPQSFRSNELRLFRNGKQKLFQFKDYPGWRGGGEVGVGGGELLYLLFRAADESGRGGKSCAAAAALDRRGTFSVRTDTFFGSRYSKSFLNEKSNSSTRSIMRAL